MSLFTLGRKPGRDPKYAVARRFALEPGVSLNSDLNVSYEPQFPPVYQQGERGTCVAQAAAGVDAFYIGKRCDRQIIDSRNAIYATGKAKNYSGSEDMQDDGMYATDAIGVLMLLGRIYEADWPYDDAHFLQVPPAALWSKAPLVPAGYRSVDCTVQGLREAIAAHGPALAGLNWPKTWFDAGSDGSLSTDALEDSAGGHETVFVGFSDRRRAFRLRNSWGDVWGERGYAWVPFDAVAAVLQDAFVLDYPHVSPLSVR